MLEYKIGHIYLNKYSETSWRLIKIENINRKSGLSNQLLKIVTSHNIKPIKYCITYSLLVSNFSPLSDFFLIVTQKYYFFISKTLKIGRRTKEVAIKDLPLYISGDKIFPEFMEELKNA